MNDQWVTPEGDPIDSDWQSPSSPLPPSNDWNDTSGCSATPGGPSITDGVIITGKPAVISSPYAWTITLNDGGSPPDFTIDHYDATNALIDHPFELSGVDGGATFLHAVHLGQDPVDPLDAVTLQYLEAYSFTDAPLDGYTYGRASGAWVEVVPQTGGTFTGSVGLSAGGAVTSGALLFVNAKCQITDISQLFLGGGSLGQVPATDGDGNLSWVTPVTGGPFVPISGATMTGALYMQGSNMIALNSPLSGGQSAIIGQKAGLNRWQLMLGDYTAEGLNNVGSNFSLVAFSTTGPALGTWLSIARADGSTVFNGAGVTVQGNLAVNGILAIATPGQFALYGGTPGQFLQTDGSGILTWATPAGSGGGIPEAPTDGQLYGRESAAWHVVPSSLPDAPSNNQTYGRNNAAWVQTVSFPEAPGDGQYYARRQLSWQAIPPGGATISDTAPASPSVGQLWWDSVGGQLYTYYNDGNSSQWVIANNVNGGGVYLPLSGGTLTGALFGADITAASSFNVNKPTASGANSIRGQTNGVNRWIMQLGNSGELGSNAGSDFALLNYSDAGALIGTPLTIARSTGNATFAQAVTAAGIASTTNVISTNGSVISRPVATGNAVFWTQNNAGANVGNFAWIAATNSVQMANVNSTPGASAYIDTNGIFNTSGPLTVASGPITATNGPITLGGSVKAGTIGGGYTCKAGQGGAYSNLFNLFWTSSTMQLWVDSTNLGTLNITPSDYRIKKDIQLLGSMWDTVKALNPISFSFKDYTPPVELERNADAKPLIVGNDEEHWGFIAHELQETLIPTAASGVKDQADCIQSPNPWTVIATLTRALQEAMERIEALEARLA